LPSEDAGGTDNVYENKSLNDTCAIGRKCYAIENTRVVGPLEDQGGNTSKMKVYPGMFKKTKDRLSAFSPYPGMFMRISHLSTSPSMLMKKRTLRAIFGSACDFDENNWTIPLNLRYMYEN
jgi:hypothetical protein